MPSKVWDEVTNSFPNFNDCTVEVWEWTSNFIPQLMIDVICLSMMELKLIYVIKEGPWNPGLAILEMNWVTILRPDRNGQHVELYFLEWKLSYLDSNFSEVCSKGSCWYISIGSINGLASNKWQAITWTKLLKITQFNVSPDLNEFSRSTAAINVLIYKMAAVSQTTLSNAFSWMKMLEFRLRFQWSLFLRVQLTIFQHWFK